MRLSGKLLWEYEGLLFLLRNLRAARHIAGFEDEVRADVYFSSCKPSDIKTVNKLHKTLRNGSQLNFWRRILYSLRGRALIATAKAADGRLIGFEMFYFKKNEIYFQTIHEAFIGVDKEFRGRGIGTQLRKYSIENLKGNELVRISTNIPKDNLPSLNSALNVGFEVSEADSSGDSHYLYLNLGSTAENSAQAK